MEYNVGQRVVCIDGNDIKAGCPDLIEGEVYTVAGITPTGGVMIKEKPATDIPIPFYAYFPKRFAEPVC